MKTQRKRATTEQRNMNIGGPEAGLKISVPWIIIYVLSHGSGEGGRGTET